MCLISAACNEAVKLAAKRGFTGLKGFVNGVLRNISRNKENIVYPDYGTGTTKISVGEIFNAGMDNKYVDGIYVL